MTTHEKLAPIIRTAVFAAAVLFFAAAGAVHAGDPVLLEKGAVIAAVIDEEDFDGLAATTSSGTTYFIWTPPSVDYEQLAAFQRKYAKKPVILKGDVYKDDRGLYIAVDILPE